MKVKKSSKAVISSLLAILMICSVMAPMAAAVSFDTTKLSSDTYLTSKTDYAVAPGITESHITTNNSTGSNQVQGYALEVDMSNPTTSVIASYKNYDPTSWGMQKVRDQAYATEKKLGVNVVAGVNGDFFNMQTGSPTGTFVMNGITYTKNDNWNYFAIKNDGTPIIGSGKLDTSDIKECVGGPCVILKDGVVTPAAASSAYGTDYHPRTAVGITADKNLIFFVADGRQAPASCGQTFAQLAESMLAMGCVDALALDGGGSTTFISQHEGEDELICRNSPSDGSERTVSNALLICSTATPSGAFDHASLSPNNKVYTPHSTVEFTAVGVDSSGYAAELPADGTFALADESFGTIDADTGVFSSNGKTGTVIVNYIYNGKVCGEVPIEIQIPDELYVANTEQAVGPGVTTDFGIVARYQDRDVTMNDGDINWTIVDASTGADLNGTAGTFSGITFTGAEDNAYNAKVTATLTSDADITLELTVFIGSKQTILYDFEYTTDADEAAASEDLEYIPSYSLPVYGQAWMIENGYGKVNALNHLGVAEKVRNDGYPLYMWPNGALTNDTVKADIVSESDGEPVRFGEHSLRIAFDFSSYNNSENGNFYLRSTSEVYAFEGSPSAIGVWVYAPEGIAGHHLYINCARNVVTGSTSYPSSAYTLPMTIDWTGWKYLELDLTGETKGNFTGGSYAPYGNGNACGVFWISYQPALGGNTTADTIYLDNMSVIYGANTSDTINPTVNYIGDLVNSIVDGETVYTSNVNTFKASYADIEDKYMTGIDDSATKMYIDGVDVTDKCYINEGDDEIYFYDAVLADGVHNIEIEVSDVFGNKTTEMRYFTIDSDSEDTEVAFTAVDKAPVLGKDYTLAITTNNAENVSAADIKVKVLSDYTSYWRDVTVVPSSNYELEGEAVYNSINDTLSFKVVRKADATAENDDGTIAKIITAVPSDVPEALEVTHRIAKGELTFASATDEKYTVSFSGKITATIISPFILSTDVMVVGTDGGYIYVTDTEGVPVEGVNIYTAANDFIGKTDANGKVYTTAYTSAVTEFSIYAEKDGLLSFIYKTQSFNAGGDTTGAPTYVKLNAAEDSATQQNISWMASPIASADKAIVKYATKADYEANGESAFKEFTGESYVAQAAASGDIATNYSVRFNSVVITGLTPDTDYVYVVGDGTNWSALKSFSTTRKGSNTNFFVLGDTQDADTKNVSAIFSQLASSGTDFDFGIQTGDAVDNAGRFSYWEGIGNVFSGEFIGEIDMVHTLGNHEFTGDTAGINAAQYFNLPGTTDEAPVAYSFQYGNVYVAAISYAGIESYKQAAEWLIKDANASQATWKILTMHQPTYFTNVGANSTEMTEVISAAVDAADIDFVFSGHDHSYARTYPLTNGVKADDGAVYFICAATSSEKGYQITSDPAIHEIATDEYNSIYLTVSTTDTTFDITVWNYDGTSHTIYDNYTAVKTVVCNDDGTHAYEYADGYLVCAVCGYSIETAGYTGFATDAATGNAMYFIDGIIQTGWFSIGSDHYYFDESGVAQTGEITIDGYTYIFGSDGKMIKGALVKEGNYWYYYINGVRQRGWFEIDGYWYFFSRTSGRYEALTGTANVEGMTYTFSDTGKLLSGAWNTTDLGTSYYWGPNPVTGLQKIDGHTYYFSADDTYMLVNESIEIDGEIYTFGDDGIFVHYGNHVDGNGDGECDECPSISTTRSFLQMLIDFFQRIMAFFRSLFG